MLSEIISDSMASLHVDDAKQEVIEKVEQLAVALESEDREQLAQLVEETAQLPVEGFVTPGLMGTPVSELTPKTNISGPVMPLVNGATALDFLSA